MILIAIKIIMEVGGNIINGVSRKWSTKWPLLSSTKQSVFCIATSSILPLLGISY